VLPAEPRAPSRPEPALRGAEIPMPASFAAQSWRLPQPPPQPLPPRTRPGAGVVLCAAPSAAGRSGQGSQVCCWQRFLLIFLNQKQHTQL